MFDLAASAASAAVADPIASLETWVRRNFGIAHADHHADHFADRVTALARQHGIDVATLLQRTLAGDRAVIIALAEAVSTNYTMFFREEELFAHLTRVIVPRLPDGEIRIWSAAAASGDEAYSLAITLLEALGPAAAPRIRILGTDLSERQIRSAEAAVYPPVHLTKVSTERRRRWFRPTGLGQHAVEPEARGLCTFRRFNLTQAEWPFTQRFHVVFLRNVLYYFEPDVRRRVLEAAFDVTEPGGWLVTSLTEPLLDIETRWTPIQPAVYRRGPA